MLLVLIAVVVIITVWFLRWANEGFARTNYQFWSYDPAKLPVEFTRTP